MFKASVQIDPTLEQVENLLSLIVNKNLSSFEWNAFREELHGLRYQLLHQSELLKNVDSPVKEITFDPNEVNVIASGVLNSRFPMKSVICLNAPAGVGKTTLVEDILMKRNLQPHTTVIVPNIALCDNLKEKGWKCLANSYVQNDIIWFDEALRFADDFLLQALLDQRVKLVIFTFDVCQYTPIIKGEKKNDKPWSYKISPFKCGLIRNGYVSEKYPNLQVVRRWNQRYANTIISSFYNNYHHLKAGNNPNHSVIYVDLKDYKDQFREFHWICLTKSDVEFVLEKKLANDSKVMTTLASQGVSNRKFQEEGVVLFTRSFQPKTWVSYNYNLSLNNPDTISRECFQAQVLTWLTRTSCRTYLLVDNDPKKVGSKYQNWKTFACAPLATLSFQQPNLGEYAKFEVFRSSCKPSKLNQKWDRLALISLSYYVRVFGDLPNRVVDFTADKGALAIKIAEKLGTTVDVIRCSVQHPTLKHLTTTRMLPPSIDDVLGKFEMAIIDTGVCATYRWDQFKTTITKLQRRCNLILIKGWVEDDKIFNGLIIPTFLFNTTKTEFHQLITKDCTLQNFHASMLMRFLENHGKGLQGGINPELNSDFTIPSDLNQLDRDLLNNLQWILGAKVKEGVVTGELSKEFPSLGWFHHEISTLYQPRERKMHAMRKVYGFPPLSAGPAQELAKEIDGKSKVVSSRKEVKKQGIKAPKSVSQPSSNNVSPRPLKRNQSSSSVNALLEQCLRPYENADTRKKEEFSIPKKESKEDNLDGDPFLAMQLDQADQELDGDLGQPLFYPPLLKVFQI